MSGESPFPDPEVVLMAGRRSRGRRFVTTAHKPHGMLPEPIKAAIRALVGKRRGSFLKGRQTWSRREQTRPGTEFVVPVYTNCGFAERPSPNASQACVVTGHPDPASWLGRSMLR